MKTFLQMMIAGAAMASLAACGGAGGEPEGDAGSQNTSAAVSGDSDSGANQASDAAESAAEQASEAAPSGQAPDSLARPSAPASSSDGDGDSELGEDREYTEADLSTAEDAMRVWAEAMARGDFETVIFATDPTSPVFGELQDMAASFASAEDNENVPPGMTEWLINVFTGPWKGAERTLVAERDNQAQFDVELAGGAVKTVDLNKYGGSWRVIATDDLMKPGDTLPPLPADPEGGN